MGRLVHSYGICDREEEEESCVPVSVYEKVTVYAWFGFFSVENFDPNTYKAHSLESGTLPPLSRWASYCQAEDVVLPAPGSPAVRTAAREHDSNYGIKAFGSEDFRDLTSLSVVAGMESVSVPSLAINT